MCVFASIYERLFPLVDWPGLVFRDLSDRLNLSRDEGEKWIVNLIRETRMGADAKIDLEKVRRVLFPVVLFILPDVIVNAQTLANHTYPGSLASFGLGLASIWMVGGGRVQPSESVFDDSGRSSVAHPPPPQTYTEIRASVFAHCLTISSDCLLVGLWFDWTMR